MNAKLSFLLIVFSLVACTPGASGGGAGASAPVLGVQTIDINLTQYAAASTQAGMGGGYAPLVVTVPLGASIRFTNTDGFAHTATAIAGDMFPSVYPFTNSALTQSGTLLSQAWSTGALDAGNGSQTFTADRSGVYLFGCFFHYGAPMRGMIIVQ
jgi:plastocyanin